MLILLISLSRTSSPNNKSTTLTRQYHPNKKRKKREKEKTRTFWKHVTQSRRDVEFLGASRVAPARHAASLIFGSVSIPEGRQYWHFQRVIQYWSSRCCDADAGTTDVHFVGGEVSSNMSPRRPQALCSLGYLPKQLTQRRTNDRGNGAKVRSLRGNRRFVVSLWIGLECFLSGGVHGYRLRSPLNSNELFDVPAGFTLEIGSYKETFNYRSGWTFD